MADAQLSQDDTQAALLTGNAAVQQLVSEHHTLDEELRRIATLSYPSLEQQLNESALKKRKLALKDRIFALVRDQARAGGAA